MLHDLWEHSKNPFSPPCGPKAAAAAVVFVVADGACILPPGRRQPLNAAFSNPFADRDSCRAAAAAGNTSSRHVLRRALYRPLISGDFFMTFPGRGL
jgi:hypothetical protein